MMKNFIFYTVLYMMVSCAVNSNDNSASGDSLHSKFGDVIITEVSAKSEYTNEFGKKADWCEIYNTTDQDIQLGEGWSLSDNEEKPTKFHFPNVTLKSHEYLMVWCDNEQQKGTDIHASFKLSAKGEFLGIYKNEKLIDGVHFEEVENPDKSFSRNILENEWFVAEKSSPGKEN